MSSQEQAVREATEKLAYKKWQDAGCPTGDGVEFWVQAESEIAAQQKSAPSKKSGSEE